MCVCVIHVLYVRTMYLYVHIYIQLASFPGSSGGESRLSSSARVWVYFVVVTKQQSCNKYRLYYWLLDTTVGILATTCILPAK